MQDYKENEKTSEEKKEEQRKAKIVWDLLESDMSFEIASTDFSNLDLISKRMITLRNTTD